MAKDNNKRTYINIIATIAMAIFIFGCQRLYSRLDGIEERLRAVEIQVAQIATGLGIRDDSQKVSGRPLTGPPVNKPHKAGG